MPLTLGKTVARLEGTVGIEEADTLLGWLEGREKAAVNLSACTRLHTAVLQILLARQPGIRSFPADPEFARLLRALLPAARTGPRHDPPSQDTNGMTP